VRMVQIHAEKLCERTIATAGQIMLVVAIVGAFIAAVLCVLSGMAGTNGIPTVYTFSAATRLDAADNTLNTTVGTADRVVRCVAIGTADSTVIPHVVRTGFIPGFIPCVTAAL